MIQNEVLENYIAPATIVKDDKVNVNGGSARDVNGTMINTDTVSCVDVDKYTVCRVSSLPFKVSDQLSRNEEEFITRL